MRVAIVSYHTPPQPAIASHRVLRLTRALCAAGHSVHWVTVDAARLGSADIDPGLNAWIPDDVVVHGIDGQALITKPAADNLWQKVWRTVAWYMPRRFAWPDSFISWARQLKRHLPRLVQEHAIDAVVMCCSPHNQILALPKLRAACPELSIYVDYRDLLSGNPWNARQNPRVANRLLALERRMLAHADVLFVNTESARTRFHDTVGAVPGVTVEVMRNAADFELAREISEGAAASEGAAQGQAQGEVRLGFFGTLFPRRRLRPVLDAIARIPAAKRGALVVDVYCDPFDSERLLSQDLEAVDADVRERVRRHDFLDYAKALRTMRAMDALILVNGPDVSDSVFVPGKMYDYLMACRPVLFIGHPGEASGIVARTTGEDWCFGYDDVDALARRIESILSNRSPDLTSTPEFAPEEAFAPLLCRLENQASREPGDSSI